MIGLAIFIFTLALIFAFVEIEIEGKYGWGEKIPTWYKKSKVYDFFNSKKPLTGYHVSMILFMLLIFHLPFFVGITWTFTKELVLVALVYIFLTTEDYLWFVFNPAYGIKNFKKENIWWYKDCHWVFGLFPFDYISVIILTFILNFIAFKLTGNIQFLINYFYFIIYLVLLILIVPYMILPIYKKFYFNLRKKDGRKDTNISHKRL